MTTISKAIEMPPPSGYGAIELKELIRKFTLRGFLITVGMTLLILLLYFGMVKIQESANAAPKLAPLVKLKLDQLAPPDQETDAPPPPPSEQIINTGPAARAGIPMPVPDAMIKPDMQEFATVKELGRASAEGGSGVDLGGFASNIDVNDTKVNVEVRESEPAPDAFIPVEKDPACDLEKLQQKIQYPDIARRAGIEGKVIVRVLVDKSGKVKKTLIDYSDSELLNDAAMKAIREYGTFTPGIQNGQPITCWVSIPVQFRLR